VPVIVVDAKDTGCVACQKVPDTATVPKVAESTITCCGAVKETAPLIGCVACQNVPVTGTVPCSWTFRKPLPSRAAGSCVLLTGCVACQNVPVTATEPVIVVDAR